MRVRADANVAATVTLPKPDRSRRWRELVGCWTTAPRRRDRQIVPALALAATSGVEEPPDFGYDPSSLAPNTRSTSDPGVRPTIVVDLLGYKWRFEPEDRVKAV